MAESSGLRQMGWMGKRMRTASRAVAVEATNPSSAGHRIDTGVAHQKANQGLGRERQVAAAQLVGLDPGVLAFDVDQPAMVLGGDAQLKGQGTARGHGARLNSGQNALEEPAQVGNVIHRVHRIDHVLIDQAAGRGLERLDHWMPHGCMHLNLGIGSFQRFGTHSTKQRAQGLRMPGSEAISRILWSFTKA